MNNSIEDFGAYSVKNVKSFMGREGYGYNATLYRGKNKIAFLIDSANGGEVSIEFINKDNEKELLEKHLKTLLQVDSEIGKLNVDAGWFVTACVEKWENERDLRKMKRQCQTKTLFRTSNSTDGRYNIIPSVYDEKMKKHLYKTYGDDIEIFNEVIKQNKIPSVFNSLTI